MDQGLAALCNFSYITDIKEIFKIKKLTIQSILFRVFQIISHFAFLYNDF